MSIGNRIYSVLLTTLLALSLSACVTVTESPFNKKASPEKAVDNYTQLGLGYLKKGRPDWARQRLNKALKINPDYAPANDGMGLLWQAEGEPDLAEESFKKALSDDASFTQARHHLGRLYSQTERFDEAEEELKEAAGDRYYDNRATAYNDLALNYFRAGKNEQAIASYREALRVMPYNVDALVNASTLLFEAQQFTESLKYFDRFDRLVQREQTRHSAHSLWLGIKLATIQQNTKRTIELAKALKQTFPKSNEYKQYQQSLSAVTGSGN